MKNPNKIVVIGAGSWGTALALSVFRSGKLPYLLTRTQEHAQSIQKHLENKKYLPNIKISSSISVSHNPNILQKSTLILWVTPTQHIQSVAEKYSSSIPPNVPIVMCCKGFNLAEKPGLSSLPSYVISKILTNPTAVLSGPNFAKEVALNLPASSTLACTDEKLAKNIGQLLHHSMFRIYLTQDIIGTQIAGALKNVIAIASGICIGKKMGENARIALITRGIAEMKRIGLKLEAKADTFIGMAGVGDLFLTSSSELSRNTKFGIALGHGKTIDEAFDAANGIVEGYHTTKALHKLLKEIDVPACISQSMYQILFNNQNVNQVIENILNTHTKWENT